MALKSNELFNQIGILHLYFNLFQIFINNNLLPLAMHLLLLQSANNLDQRLNPTYKINTWPNWNI